MKSNFSLYFVNIIVFSCTISVLLTPERENAGTIKVVESFIKSFQTENLLINNL